MTFRPTPPIQYLRPSDRRAIIAALGTVPHGERWAIALAPALARMLHDGGGLGPDPLFVGGVPMIIDPGLAPLRWELRKLS